LMKQIGSRNLLCVGTGWQKYGIPNQLVAWGSLLNVIYNLGKVCVNVHTDAQILGQEKQLDLNNRVFDLAMAGCCQISDNSEAVRFVFREDEVVATNEPQAWIDCVIDLIDHPVEAESFRRKALQRALCDHTWLARATEFLGRINGLLPRWKPVPIPFAGLSLALFLAKSPRRIKRMISKISQRSYFEG